MTKRATSHLIGSALARVLGVDSQSTDEDTRAAWDAAVNAHSSVLRLADGQDAARALDGLLDAPELASVLRAFALGLLRSNSGHGHADDAAWSDRQLLRATPWTRYAESLTHAALRLRGFDGATTQPVFEALFAFTRSVIDGFVGHRSLTDSVLLPGGVWYQPTVDPRPSWIELAASSLTPSDVRDTAERMRRYTLESAGWLIPPHIDASRRVRMDELYVEPAVDEVPQPGLSMRSRVSFTAFLDSTYRSVILGNPGAGKSTLAQRLCQRLAMRDGEGQSPHQVIPLLLPLRHFAASQDVGHRTLLGFAADRVSHLASPVMLEAAIHYLAAMGMLCCVFDGLDELLETTKRVEVTRELELVAARYPLMPIVVTSRIVGYDTAPLTRREFRAYRIAAFDDERVSAYARNWFALGVPSTTGEREVVDGFLAETARVPDLTGNPLLLALLCQIYRGQGYIPRNRPDVYEKCAVLLFERWDRSRGLFAPTTIEAHLRPAMEHLAFWMYTHPELRGGATESALIGEVTTFLHASHFEDVAAARAAALEFVEFCRGRAWVFTEVGTLVSGEGIYQFAHQTFLEYFAALHIVRHNTSPDALLRVLAPRIVAGEWDVVASLAVQTQDRFIAGGANSFMDELLALVAGGESGTDALLSFAARSLDYLLLDVSMARRIATACSQWLTATANTASADAGILLADTGRADEIFDGLLRVRFELRGPVAETVIASLLGALSAVGVSRRRVWAATTLLNLPVHASRRRMAGSDLGVSWRAAVSQAMASAIPALREVGAERPHVDHDLVFWGIHDPVDFIRRHGFAGVIANRPLHRVQSPRPCLGDWLLGGVLGGGTILADATELPFDRLCAALAEIGRMVGSTQPPRRSPRSAVVDGRTLLGGPGLRGLAPDSFTADAQLGVIVLLLGYVQAASETDLHTLSESLPWGFLATAMASASLATSVENAPGYVSSGLCLTPAQVAFLDNWIFAA